MQRFLFSLISLFFSLNITVAATPERQTNNSKTALDSIIKETAEQLVQRQLDAYNARNIEAFVATYAPDIVLNEFPDKLICSGIDALRKKYTTLFENTPDLFCDLKNRIVMGNKVIDQEHVLKNGKFINAVAVYEVTNGLISKVTFIR